MLFRNLYTTFYWNKKKYDEKVSMFPILTWIFFLRILLPSTCYVNYNHNYLKNKCAQYWPDINDKLQGGTLTVRHLEEKSYAEYIIRRFKMHNKTVNNYIKNYKAIFTYRVWFRSFCISKTCLLMCICLNNLITLIKCNCCKVKKYYKEWYQLI